MIIYEKCSKIIKIIENLPLYCYIELYVPSKPPLFFSNTLNLIKYLKEMIIYYQNDIDVEIYINKYSG